MNIEVLLQARWELYDAVDYYERQAQGLGQRLWDEVDQHIEWIAKYSKVPVLREGGFRRVNLKTFPYYIAYITLDCVWILAIAHSHAQPNYFVDRQLPVR